MKNKYLATYSLIGLCIAVTAAAIAAFIFPKAPCAVFFGVWFFATGMLIFFTSDSR